MRQSQRHLSHFPQRTIVWRLMSACLFLSVCMISFISMNRVLPLTRWQDGDSVPSSASYLHHHSDYVKAVPADQCPYCAAGQGKGVQLLGPPFISQVNTGLYNGCEAVCATMLLQNIGMELSAGQYVSWYLELQPMLVIDDLLYGPDPAAAYAGTPYSRRMGWGCFAPVITAGLQQALADTPYQALDLTGSASLDEIVHTYVAQSYPVAVWVVRNMRIKEGEYEWSSYDGEQMYTYPHRQHCMLLVGHDELFYYFYDPDNVEKTVVRFEKERAERSFLSMGSQAVVIVPDSWTGTLGTLNQERLTGSA